MPDSEIRFTIKQGYVVHYIFITIAILILGVVLYNIIRHAGTNYVAYLVFFGMAYSAYLVMSSRYYAEFDVEKKHYYRYARILGVRIGSRRPFNYVDKLYVNKVNLVWTNKYGRFIATSSVRSVVYKCFLKFDDGEKIELDSDIDLDRLLNRLKRYNKLLRTSIFDTTTHEVVLVESLENG